MNTIIRLCACVIAMGASLTTHAGTVVLSTDENRIESTSWNQGWWALGGFNANTSNVSPIIGTSDGTHRDYFTFLIPAAVSGQPVIAATLLEHRGGSLLTNEAEETIGFFDVSTDYDVLNHNVGSNFAIYNDLGTGVSYGQFSVPGAGDPETLLEFPLNAAAVSAINGAAGNYFSIGGSLLSDDGNDAIFGGNTHGPAELRLVTVPEPTTTCLIALGLCGVALARTYCR